MEYKNSLKQKVAERRTRIQENKDKQAEQKKALLSLEHTRDFYNNEYNSVQNDIQGSKSQYETRMRTIGKSIDKLRTEFTDIENEAAVFQKEVEPAVTDNLTQVATLSNSLRHKNSIGSQITSIIRGM